MKKGHLVIGFVEATDADTLFLAADELELWRDLAQHGEIEYVGEKS